MKTYRFNYIETYVKSIEVEAESREDAYEKAEYMAEEGIETDFCNDFDHWDIELVSEGAE